MGRPERLEALTKLEEARNSRVLAYFLSDRDTFPPGVPGFSAMLGSEPQLIFAELLRGMGRVPRLDLVLQTRGGATDAVWPFVTLLRGYCDHLAVLVPYRAHSAGTMICLGADEVLMTSFSELSPIDPTTGNQFNPRDPANPGALIPISVEDVGAYFDLAKERGSLSSSPEVWRALVQTVHPLALGNVQRVYLLIRRLGQRLLSLHMDEAADKEVITRIIDGLTKEFYSHVHAINRNEAIALMGDWVKAPTDPEETALLSLFDHYVADLKLREKFSLPREIRDELSLRLSPIAGVIETTERCFEYETELMVSQRVGGPGMPPGLPQPPQTAPLAQGSPRAYDFSVLQSAWREHNPADG